MKLAKLSDIGKFVGDKRYIIVGDLHGLYAEFQELLKVVSFDLNKDIMISVGDLTDRGPNSLGVLDWFINNNQPHILGNHDDKLRRYLKGNPIKISNGLEKTIKEIKDLPEDIRLIKCEKYFNHLSDLPNILRLPNFGSQRQFVVHGGFDLNRPIELQEINDCLRKRNLNDKSEERWYVNYTGTDRYFFGHQITENWNPHKNIFALDGGPLGGGVLRACINGIDLVEIKPHKNYMKDL